MDAKIENYRAWINDALKARQDLCLNVRSRLQSGYDARRCMAQVAGQQCAGAASFNYLFDGVVGFCGQHRSASATVFRDAEEAERLLSSEKQTGRAIGTVESSAGVYIVINRTAGRAKIGHTIDREKRVAAHRASSPGDNFVEAAWFPSDSANDAQRLERDLQDHFADKRIGRGEWFKVTDEAAFVEEARARSSAMYPLIRTETRFKEQSGGVC